MALTNELRRLRTKAPTDINKPKRYEKHMERNISYPIFVRCEVRLRPRALIGVWPDSLVANSQQMFPLAKVYALGNLKGREHASLDLASHLFRLQTFDQQTNTPDPQLREALVAYDKKYDEAFNNNDASPWPHSTR